jgi:hypothetical protein
LGFSVLKSLSLRRYLSYQLASGREASYPSPRLKPTIQPSTQDAEYEEQVYPSTRTAPVHGSSTIACKREQLECTQHSKTGHPCVDAPEVVLRGYKLQREATPVGGTEESRREGTSMVQAKTRWVYSVNTNSWKPARDTVTQDTTNIARMPLINGRTEEASTGVSTRYLERRGS